jgi:DNA replication protein DnaC
MATKQPDSWIYVAVNHPSELKPGDRIPLYTEPHAQADCDNCKSITGQMFSFVVAHPKKDTPVKWFPTNEDGTEGELLSGNTESAPCPICSIDKTVRRLRDLSGLVGMELEGKEALGLRLANFDPKPGQKDSWEAARTILMELPEIKTSALLFGSNGSGKTHLLCCLINGCLVHNVQAHYATAESLLERLRATYNDQSRSESTEQVRSFLENVAALAIDEFEKVQWTAWAGEQLYAIIERRHSTGRSTWFASNDTPDELRESNEFGSSIVSRMEAGITVGMVTDDMRSGYQEPAP